MIKQILHDDNYNRNPLFFEYLNKKGYSRQLLHKYVLNGWFERIANGVYKKPELEVTPIAIVTAIQKQLGEKVYLGATAALSEQNVNFNLRQTRVFEVFTPSNYKPTRWLKSVKQIRWVKASLFKTTNGLHIYNEILMSTPERAILEAISLIPRDMEYEEAYHLLEILPTLRKSLLQELLEDCKSIKTKRLFLYMSEMVAHGWFAGLNINSISLGSGDRQIVKKGVYNRKYKIVVPEIT